MSYITTSNQLSLVHSPTSEWLGWCHGPFHNKEDLCTNIYTYLCAIIRNALLYQKLICTSPYLWWLPYSWSRVQSPTFGSSETNPRDGDFASWSPRHLGVKDWAKQEPRDDSSFPWPYGVRPTGRTICGRFCNVLHDIHLSHKSNLEDIAKRKLKRIMYIQDL